MQAYLWAEASSKKEIWYSSEPPAVEKFPMWAFMMETDDLFMPPEKVKRCEGRL
jgi:hypothetical protein